MILKIFYKEMMEIYARITVETIVSIRHIKTQDNVNHVFHPVKLVLVLQYVKLVLLIIFSILMEAV